MTGQPIFRHRQATCTKNRKTTHTQNQNIKNITERCKQQGPILASFSLSCLPSESKPISGDSHQPVTYKGSTLESNKPVQEYLGLCKTCPEYQSASSTQTHNHEVRKKKYNCDVNNMNIKHKMWISFVISTCLNTGVDGYSKIKTLSPLSYFSPTEIP